MFIDQAEIENWFRYHPPTREQLAKYEAIRLAGKNLATVILATTPRGADQSDAIRKVRESVMAANSAIACKREVIMDNCCIAQADENPRDQYDPRKVG